MKNHAPESQAYKDCQAELNLLLIEMEKAGLAERDEKDNLIPLEKMQLPAVSVPDIVVSGGNINVKTDSLTGSGKMTAQRAAALHYE